VIFGLFGASVQFSMFTWETVGIAMFLVVFNVLFKALATLLTTTIN
jgi:hypothetical protein